MSARRGGFALIVTSASLGCGALLSLGEPDNAPAAVLDAATLDGAVAPPADAAASPSPDASAADVLGPPPVRRVFVTSEKWDGNLGGLAGADQKCSAAAKLAGLGDRFAAFLASSEGRPEDRYQDRRTYVRIDGEPLFTGIIKQGFEPPVPLDVTEKQGTSLPPSVFDFAWTGVAGGTSDTCKEWTTNETNVFAGYGDARTASEWLDSAGKTAGCDDPHHLYCFEL